MGKPLSAPLDDEAPQLTLSTVLQAMGVTFPKRRVKLIRHQDSRYNTAKLLAANQLRIYQDNQGKPVFKLCDSILSFAADGGRRSEFLGLYHIRNVTHDPNRKWPEHFMYKGLRPGAFWYDTDLDPRLTSLIRRLVIDWGGATRAWHQWLDAEDDKTVIEIRAAGRHMVFPGYDEVILTFPELCQIMANPASNPDWHHALSKVSGVYLIQDPESGNLYVGSAYGMQGIWGRWREYADTCHGGNMRLKRAHADDPERHRRYRFSILKTLPLSAEKDDVLAYEANWKQKLGSRAFGLNAN